MHTNLLYVALRNHAIHGTLISPDNISVFPTAIILKKVFCLDLHLMIITELQLLKSGLAS